MELDMEQSRDNVILIQTSEQRFESQAPPRFRYVPKHCFNFAITTFSSIHLFSLRIPRSRNLPHKEFWLFETVLSSAHGAFRSPFVPPIKGFFVLQVSIVSALGPKKPVP